MISDMTKNYPRHTHQGIQYLEFLGRYGRLCGARSYFEIGVNIGKSLRRIDLPTVGVDPKFMFRDDIMGAKSELHLFQTTSDVFFQTRDLKSFFPAGVELAFLDGMHLFEFLLRDLINTEMAMSRSGTIFIHDCLPINAEMTERQRRPGQRRDVELKSYWTGDVWKLIPILQHHRPDLEITLIDCAPTGLVRLRNLNPESRTLSDIYDILRAEWESLEIDDTGLADLYASLKMSSAAEVLGELGS